MSYDDNNRGAVWPNKKREQSTHPHWTGQATIDGTEYWVSAWKKADDAAEKAPSISFTFKLKEEARSTQEPRRQATDDLDLNDPIPF